MLVFGKRFAAVQGITYHMTCRKMQSNPAGRVIFPRSWISFSLSRFVGRWQLYLHIPSTWIHCGWNMMLTRQCLGEFTSQDIERGGVDGFILNWIRKRKAIQAVSEKKYINSRQSLRTNQRDINLMSIEQKLAVAMMIGIELWTCKMICMILFDSRHKT